MTPDSSVIPATIVLLFVSASVVAANGDTTLTPADPPATVGSLAPHVSTAPDGSVLLSWLEGVDPDDTSGRRGMPTEFRLRFARFRGGTWSEARTIIEGVPFFANWADVPSIIETANGALIAHWPEKSGEGTYAYDVQLARSADGGETWSRLGPAHNDGVETEHGFVSMVREAGGARAFWLDGRNMYLDEEAGAAAGNDHGHGAGSMTVRTAFITDRVTRGMMLDERVCECCNTSAVVTEAGPIVFYRDRSPEEIRDIWMVRYDGMEWTSPRPVHDDGWMIPGCPVNGPAADASGKTIVVAWYTAANSEPQIRAAFSTDAGETFGKPVVVDDDRPIGRTDIVLDSDGTAIVCWLDMDVMSGTIAARRVATDGRMSQAVSLAQSSVQRSSGFPRLTRVDDSLLLVWTEDAGGLRIRAATLETGQIPQIADESPTDED